MSLAIVTRGYVAPRGGVVFAPAELSYLHPSAAAMKQNAQLEMAIIFTDEVSGDKIVTLVSDDTNVVTVPANVTVLDGNLVVLFYASSLAIGTATITASHGGIDKTSDIEVVSIDPSLRPEVRETINLKPEVASARNLRPKSYDTEES